MRSRHSVEPVSYEADLTRVLKWAVFCHGLVVLILIIVKCGYPYTIGTDMFYLDVAYVSMAIHIGCKHLFKMFHLFQTYVAYVAVVIHICCKRML
jgi:hypothetical protein